VNVVLDTNIYVGAAITPAGPAGQVLQAWRTSLFTVVVSEQLLSEFERVLTYPQVQRYLRLGSNEIAELFDQLRLFAILVDAEARSGLARDPDDNFVLDTAAAGEAQYIVTNDDDLLDLGDYGGIEIVTAARFLGILQSQSGG
jgi:putative PIN family toxin of toxin-antitoxin system